ARVEVLGRLGSFGLSAMKTKADRMWDEFAANLVARITADAGAPAETPPAGMPVAVEASDAAPAAVATAPATGATASVPVPAPSTRVPAEALASRAGRPPGFTQGVTVPPPRTFPSPARATFWQRVFGGGPSRAADDIAIEIRRGDTLVRVFWPVQNA